MMDPIARKRRSIEYDDRSLALPNSSGGAVRKRVSLVAAIACFLAFLLVSRQFSTPARVATALHDAAISEHLATLSSAFADVARRVRDEEFSDSVLSPTVEPISVSITLNNSTSHNQTGSHSKSEWQLPPSLLYYAPASRGSREALAISAHPWTQPRVLTSYSRVLNESSFENETETEIFVYATGVTMGNFNRRNLSIAGCLIGTDIYPIEFHLHDVFLCIVPRRILPGELISLVVRFDEALINALGAPVILGPGFNVSLTEGVDINTLPQNCTFHLNGYLTEDRDVESYRQIASEHHASTVEEPAKSTSRKSVRYEICAATMMKQFVHLLDDWIDYHRRLGVDHVIILDNDATDDLEIRYASRPDVEVIYWPFQRSQVQGISLLMVAARSRCEWLLVFDADEYVMIGLGAEKENANKRILKTLLGQRRQEGYDDVRFRYLTMGPSGNVYIPERAVPEAYIARWPSQKANVKSASITDRDWLVSKIHFQKGRFVPRTYSSKVVNFTPVTLEDDAALVHYQFRSLEEVLLKKKYGSSSIGDKNLDSKEFVETRSLERPSKAYTVIPDELRYTYFRDLWQSVTDATEIKGRTLVRWKGPSRCVVIYDDTTRSVTEESCRVEGDQYFEHI